MAGTLFLYGGPLVVRHRPAAFAGQRRLLDRDHVHIVAGRYQAQQSTLHRQGDRVASARASCRGVGGGLRQAWSTQQPFERWRVAVQVAVEPEKAARRHHSVCCTGWV